MMIFQLFLTPLIGETPFAMTSFVQMAAYPNNGRAGIVAHPGSAADCRAPYYVAHFGIRRNKKSGTFNNIKYIIQYKGKHSLQAICST